MMKKLVGVICCAVFGMVLAASAQDQAVQDTTLKGTVAVEKSDNAVKAVTLKVDENTVVTLTGNDELAKEDGKNVEVTGVVTEQDGKKSMTVKSFKVLASDCASKAN